MLSPDRLVGIKEVSELLNVSVNSLRIWDKTGAFPALRTPGGVRRYRLSDVLRFQGITTEPDEPMQPHGPAVVAVYARVSSHEQKQKGDLARQAARLVEYCEGKNYTVTYTLEEVGSGLNDSRPKLNRLFRLAIGHTINKVIVEHKDRLTRFNFGIFDLFFKSHGVTIEWIEDVLPKSYEAELVEDIISLMFSFSAKVYGKRSSNSKQNKQKQATP